MMTAENKNEMNALLASYKMTSRVLSPSVSDAAMLATVAKMAQDGKDEMALYVLRNIKPYALAQAEDDEEKEKPEIDIDRLLSALLG